MAIQILVGTSLIVFTVVLASYLIAFGVDILSRHLSTVFANVQRTRLTLTLMLVTVWLVLIFTIVMWIWAVAFWTLAIFDSFETALYFSMVSFTTLGFGDVILQEYFTGAGVGIELIARHGEIFYAFQHRRLHEVPLSGGGSSLRKSQAVSPALLDASSKLISALQWKGVAMVELSCCPP